MIACCSSSLNYLLTATSYLLIPRWEGCTHNMPFKLYHPAGFIAHYFYTDIISAGLLPPLLAQKQKDTCPLLCLHAFLCRMVRNNNDAMQLFLCKGAKSRLEVHSQCQLGSCYSCWCHSCFLTSGLSDFQFMHHWSSVKEITAAGVLFLFEG